MQEVSAPWKAGAVLVCANEREPGAKKPSCGLERGSELRQWLKDRIKAEGLKGEILSVRTGCLGVCSALGVTVAICPADGQRRVFVVDPVNDREDLWALARSVMQKPATEAEEG